MNIKEKVYRVYGNLKEDVFNIFVEEEQYFYEYKFILNYVYEDICAYAFSKSYCGDFYSFCYIMDVESTKERIKKHYLDKLNHKVDKINHVIEIIKTIQ